jgi:hypothetical protein
MVSQPKFDHVVKWTALFFTLAGAVLSTLNLWPFNIISFNLGSTLYLIWSVRVREWNLVCVNGGLLVIYAFGLFLI